MGVCGCAWGGGGAAVFAVEKCYISTLLGGALKISNFITYLYRTVTKINYVFHADSAQIDLFQKYSSAPSWKLNSVPLANITYIGQHMHPWYTVIIYQMKEVHGRPTLRLSQPIHDLKIMII